MTQVYTYNMLVEKNRYETINIMTLTAYKKVDILTTNTGR